MVYFLARSSSIATAGRLYLPRIRGMRAATSGDVEILSAIPNRSIAGASPPPAIENASLSAISVSHDSVPLRKFGNSNTPTGPFHRIVFAFFRISASFCAETSPSPESALHLDVVNRFQGCGSSFENSVATRTSVGTEDITGTQTFGFVNQIRFVQIGIYPRCGLAQQRRCSRYHRQRSAGQRFPGQRIQYGQFGRNFRTTNDSDH